MSLESEVAILTALAPLRIEKKKDGVLVSLEKAKIYDIPLKLAFEEAKANPDNIGTYGSRAGIYQKLKPEVEEQFKDACKNFAAEAPAFTQAVAKMLEDAAAPGKVLGIGHETADGGTAYSYFKYDKNRSGFCKALPEDFKP